MPLTLRPYQEEALAALSEHFAKWNDNPCVVLPTGSGKSFVMAELIRRMMWRYPGFRCIVLAHRQELVSQNSDEFKNVSPDVGIGIYCNKLQRHDVNEPVIFAMIQSVFRHADKFPPVDMIIVDEAHHIPISDDAGMYRVFLRGIQAKRPGVKVVGFTATPYRLDVGHVCHEDYVLNKVCYEANVGDLIKQGYLCNLRSKVSKLAPKLDDVPEVGGDYKNDALSKIVCVSELVRKTVDDALSRLCAEKRKCCVWFCVDVKHCEMVRDALREYYQTVGMVTGETPNDERSQIIERFKNGEIRHLVNVMVFTEGFNVKQVDAVVLLRPTLSRGLYVQMVGRGLRVHQNKQDCLILDYARCIAEHGPIDVPPDKYIPMEVCPQCDELFPRALHKCPKCGYEVSAERILKHEACDAKREIARRMHDEIVSCREILAQEYGGVSKLRQVNPGKLVRLALCARACRIASAGSEYCVKHDRPVLGKTLGEFEKEFYPKFIRYAQYVELTNLPDMLKDYFENEKWHDSEIFDMPEEQKAKAKQKLLEKINEIFARS